MLQLQIYTFYRRVLLNPLDNAALLLITQFFSSLMGRLLLVGVINPQRKLSRRHFKPILQPSSAPAPSPIYSGCLCMSVIFLSEPVLHFAHKAVVLFQSLLLSQQLVLYLIAVVTIIILADLMSLLHHLYKDRVVL